VEIKISVGSPACNVFVFLYLQYCMSVNYCQCRQLKSHIFKSRLNKCPFFFIINCQSVVRLAENSKQWIL
jgi:hypothetical protein